MAELWAVQKRPDAAAAALEKVLALDAGNRPAFQQLRALHAAAGNWRAYADLCLLFAPHAEPEERLALLKEVAVLREQRLGEKHMASLAWNRVLGEAPGDEQALAECWRLAQEGKDQDTLAVVIEDAADKARGMVRARLLLKLGQLLDAPPLDDAEGAENAIRRALEADPANPEVLDALADLFKRRGRIQELVITIEQKLESAAGLDEKKGLLLEVSRLYDGVLHDVDEAVTALRRILELDGGDPAALEALAAIFRREHRWGELAAVLARARDLAGDDAARLGWQLQIAGLDENEIGDDEAAVEDYRTVLGLDDRNAAALAGLERLYTKLDRFAELNRVYERQVQLSDRSGRAGPHPGPERRHLRGEDARPGAGHRSRTRPSSASTGGNLPAIKALERLYREQGLFDRLLTVMAHHLELLTDRKEQVALMVSIGDVWWKEMSRVDRAEATFNQAIQLDPESRQAVAALGRLYERSGNWNLALDMLQREARIAGASRDAVDIYVRIGSIDEDMLLDLAAAKEAYGKALALDPGCLPALRAMKGIAEREGNRDGYLELLTAEARYAEDDEQRADRWTEVGRHPPGGARRPRGGGARLRGGPEAQCRTTCRRPGRSRTSTSACSAGRTRPACWSPSSGPWRAAATPRSSAARATGRATWPRSSGSATRRCGATGAPTSSTPPTCRRWRGWATCWWRRGCSRRRCASSPPSSSTTGTSSPTWRWWRPTGRSARWRRSCSSPTAPSAASRRRWSWTAATSPRAAA